MRRDVSLLLSEGHPQARHYPIAMVWSESRIVRQRNAARVKRDTVVLQMAIASNFGKKAGKQLETLLKEMDESD